MNEVNLEPLSIFLHAPDAVGEKSEAKQVKEVAFNIVRPSLFQRQKCPNCRDDILVRQLGRQLRCAPFKTARTCFPRFGRVGERLGNAAFHPVGEATIGKSECRMLFLSTVCQEQNGGIRLPLP
jgi:hypothetical protein